MDLALEEAQKGFASGEVPVGAVIIDPYGEILSTQHNRVEQDLDPTAHAEILCLRKAARILHNNRLEGCVLVSTLEPCVMCAAACINAHIDGLVFGAADPAAGAIISSADLLDISQCHSRIWHMGGILAEKCAALLNNFFKLRRNSIGK